MNRENLIDYWSDKIYEGKLNMDWSDLKESCWCCVSSNHKEVLINETKPKDYSNTFLLCDECSNDLKEKREKAAEYPRTEFSEVEWLVSHRAVNYRGTDRSHLLAHLYLQNEIKPRIESLFSKDDLQALNCILDSFLTLETMMGKGYFFNFDGYKNIIIEIVNAFREKVKIKKTIRKVELYELFPCDDNGMILGNEPQSENYEIDGELNYYSFKSDLDEYHKAIEKVLFKGHEIYDDNKIKFPGGQIVKMENISEFSLNEIIEMGCKIIK